MTLHAPAQHAGLTGHDWIRDVLIVGAVVLLTILVVWAATMVRQDLSATTTTEAQSLIEFRAAERASWAASGTDEDSSLIEFRAGERQ